MNTLRTELRRAVRSVGCLLAAVGTALVLLGTAWPELAEALERGRLYVGFSGAAVLNALAGAPFSLALPILSPLAYSGTWAEEWGMCGCMASYGFCPQLRSGLSTEIPEQRCFMLSSSNMWLRRS